jgi:tetratricopeptide (TPR) repeat protein
MSKVDTEPLRQLYQHLGVKPDYRISSFVSFQLQERNPEEKLPATLTRSIDDLRDLAVMNRDSKQIGALDFDLGLDFLQGGRNDEAAAYFEAARRQWLFSDDLSLISLAHFAAGMAHHGAEDYSQAAAAYFKVKQCLQQAEAEPYLLEKITAERNLEDFWNDLVRQLNVAVDRLRRDFREKQDRILRAALGDFPGQRDSGSKKQDALTTLTLQMQPTRAMSVDDVDLLIFKTLDGIELLSSVLTPSGADERRPKISRLTYAGQNPITIEIDNVAKNAVNLIRWLVKSISVEEPQPASTPGGEDGSESWFRWRAQPGYMAEILKKYTKSATGKVLDEAQIDQLMQAIGHLAELRLNCQLTVK